MNKFNLMGSSNSRYFLEVNGRELALYRENKLLWKKTQETSKFDIIGVGNNGAVVIRTDEGIYFHSLFSEEPEYYIESLGKTSLEETSSIIQGVMLNNRGEDLCMERIQYESSMKSRFFNMFTSNTPAQDVKIHNIIFFNIQTGSQVSFMQVKIKANERNFRWEVSRDFNYMLYEDIRASRKSATRFCIAYTPEETVYQEFDFPATDFDRLYLNNSGTACVEGKKEERKIWNVVTLKGKVYEFTGPLSQQFCHLGRYFVVFYDSDKNHLVWLTFDQKRKIVADLNHLDRAGLTYAILFNEKDELDYVIKRDKGLEVYSLDMESFETETRRRARESQDKKENDASVIKKADKERQLRDEQRSRTERKIRELGRTFAQASGEKDFPSEEENGFKISESRKKMLLEISNTAELIHRIKGEIPAEDLDSIHMQQALPALSKENQSTQVPSEDLPPVKPRQSKMAEELPVPESKPAKPQMIKLSSVIIPAEPSKTVAEPEPVKSVTLPEESPKTVAEPEPVKSVTLPEESPKTVAEPEPIKSVTLAADTQKNVVEPEKTKKTKPREAENKISVKPQVSKPKVVSPQPLPVGQQLGKKSKDDLSASELLMILEKYKLRLITGSINQEDFDKVKLEIEARLKKAANPNQESN